MFRQIKQGFLVNSVIHQKMITLFPNWTIRNEWNAMSKDEVFYYKKQIYKPRIDIAVGPFAMNEQFVNEYNCMINESSIFLQKILDFHAENISDKLEILTLESLKNTNLNPRCFMAIEVESMNRPSKYLMGSIINATALGKIAILVARNNERFRQIVSLYEYIYFLYSLSKNVTNPQNLIVLSYEQINEALEE